jgi:hypothetical protein
MEMSARIIFSLGNLQITPLSRCSKNRAGCKINRKFALQELQISKFPDGLDQQHFSPSDKAANRIIFGQLLHPWTVWVVQIR